jgi:hypothetical protein
MITDYGHQILAQDALHPGRPQLVDESLEENVAHFFLHSQHDRTHATFADVIDFIGSNGVTVDRLWSAILSGGAQNGCVFKR